MKNFSTVVLVSSQFHFRV